MPELDLNRDTVQFIIDKAHEFHSQDDVTFDDEPVVLDEDWAMQVAADYAGDPYYRELKTTIDDLEPDQQVSLVALMWLGRGDFSIDEWNDGLQQAEDSWTDHTADYLLGTAMLADYLAAGLEQFESSEEE